MFATERIDLQNLGSCCLIDIVGSDACLLLQEGAEQNMHWRSQDRLIAIKRRRREKLTNWALFIDSPTE